MTELLSVAPKGAEVEYEGLDDVCLTTALGHCSLYQTKSALESNPIADRAVAFWKTLANWADVVRQKGWDGIGLRLVLYVSNQVNAGSFAKLCSSARTDEEADIALATIQTEIWGPPPDFALRSSVAKDLAPHVERFFSAPTEVQRVVVRCSEIEIVPIDSYTALQGMLRFVDPKRWNDVIHHACGWTKQQVDQLIAAKKPAVIKAEAFAQEMTTYIRKFNERSILRSFAPAGPSATEQDQLRLRTFVRQLELIALDYPDQLQAISDYYRAAIDRTQLGESGEIHPKSLDDLDNQLHRIWKNISQRKSIELPAVPAEKRGESVYRECVMQNVTVENQQPQPHFIPGCFHVLAEEMKLGWHPDFTKLLALSPVISKSA